MFRSLPPAAWSEDALKKLAGTGRVLVEGAIETPGMVSPPEVDETHRKLPFAPPEDPKKRLQDDEENSGIDAGYTYLGQFIDHDITFDPASSLQKRNDVNALVDFRTPQLDLDSVYGGGPNDQPYMYQGRDRHGNVRLFQLGRKLTEGKGGKHIGDDLPRHTWTDPNGKTYHRALIGDKRNDENVIISQLHGVFLKFHNRFATDNPDMDFGEVQRHVRWHYQYVILHDFLYKIARKDVIESVLPHFVEGSIFDHPPKLRFYKPKHDAFMPIEFAAAAYRFGHSMVRPIYRLNTKLTGGNDPDTTDPNEKDRGIDGRQFIFAGLKDRGLNGFDEFPAEWGIDWNLFFDLTEDKDKRFGKERTQPSYKIDTSLVNPLAFLPEFSDVKATPPLDDIAKLQATARKREIPNLALRNLLRGMSMSLPSGQDVAQLMGLIPIKDEKLRVGKATNKADYEKSPTLVSLDSEFKNKAPLWYYVLAEAQHEWNEKGGNEDGSSEKAPPIQLGEVGSRIIVETLVGMLLDDGHSVLREAPAWTPSIGKGAKFDMPDFIKYAINDLKYPLKHS